MSGHALRVCLTSERVSLFSGVLGVKFTPTNQHFDVRVELGCKVGWEKEVIRCGLRSEVRSLVRSKKRSGMQKRG
jgi:hypothetical protein